MRRNIELEATIVEKYALIEACLDERGRRVWAATESRAIGYGGDALVSDATGLSRPTIRAGRREIESGTVLLREHQKAGGTQATHGSDLAVLPQTPSVLGTTAQLPFARTDPQLPPTFWYFPYSDKSPLCRLRAQKSPSRRVFRRGSYLVRITPPYVNLISSGTDQFRNGSTCFSQYSRASSCARAILLRVMDSATSSLTFSALW